MEQQRIAADTDALLQQYCRTRDVSLRNELLSRYSYIAQIAAKKFSSRGVEFEDLQQTAVLALLKALERFDCTRDIKFSTFATPCVIGEIKNYFRDKSRIVRLPRRNSEMLRQMEQATDELVGELGDQPKAWQIAEKMGVSVETVHELMEIRSRLRILSLDTPVSGEDGDWSIEDTIGQEDPSYLDVENQDLLKKVFQELSPREQALLSDRYLKGKSQRTLAQELGVSQMYISRLERRVLEKVRRYL